RALKVAPLSRLLGRVRRISTFFHRSTTANHYLKEKQKCLGLKNHKLITDVATRWNRAYDMVERFLEQQPAICATLLSPENMTGTIEEDSPMIHAINNAIKTDLLKRYNRGGEIGDLQSEEAASLEKGLIIITAREFAGTVLSLTLK
ncbi:hypothetical protein KUCAC02_013865, partial [Chaenocephalus aceratus]